MNNAKKMSAEIYENTEGLKEIDVVERPPKIKWGDKFKSWPLEKQNDYLRRFSESMNHAADTIMQERDALGQLAEKKEEQIIQLKEALDANTLMLQTEITKMNEYRQEAQQHAAQLQARIRELESAHTG